VVTPVLPDLAGRPPGDPDYGSDPDARSASGGGVRRIGTSNTAHVTDPRIRLGYVIVRGAKLRLEVQEAVTSATLSWSTDEVTQLAMTVEDPEFVIWRSGQFAKDTLVVYREPPMDDVRLRITSLSLDGGASGTGGFQVSARSEGRWLLMRRQGPLVMPKASPSAFVLAECKAVGLKAVVQPSPTRTQVARDVPKEGEASRGAARPSSWTTFQRLAQELGYYLFEYGGTVYFGQPSWLMKQPGDPLTVSVPFHKTGLDERFAALNIPSITMSEDAEVPVEISGLQLHKSRLAECRPGRNLHLRGLHPFIAHYLVTSMTVPLLGTGPIELAASTPHDPPPQPPEQATSSGGGFDSVSGSVDSSGAAQQSGSKSAHDFVTVALSQRGDRYVFGAEANLSSANPSAFDCSELIEWALARVGIRFVDGSANQIAKCRSISVQQAIRTRGALLYKPGHIGISLGNGQTMEARNSRVGVGVFRAADIAWTQGGLVPGLRYA
jgi:cell wall-associated NlpC family hydrolase